MGKDYSRGTWFIWLTLFLALAADMLPYPASFLRVKPEITLLLLLFWILYQPKVVGVATAFLLGLFLDVLYGAQLGQHALTLSIVAWFSLSSAQRIRIWKASQQSVFIFVIVGIYQTLNHWLAGVNSLTQIGLWYLLPALLAAVLWPLLTMTLTQFARGAGVEQH